MFKHTYLCMYDIYTCMYVHRMMTAVRIQNDVAKLEKINGELTKNLYCCQLYTHTLINIILSICQNTHLYFYFPKLSLPV